MSRRGKFPGWQNIKVGPDGKLMDARPDGEGEPSPMPASKHRNIPSFADGIRFASKLERDYYLRLVDRVKAGEVRWFIRQVPFHLPGKTTYRADFLEFYPDGRCRVVDVKGRETDMFRLKRRQVEALYPIRVELEKARGK